MEIDRLAERKPVRLKMMNKKGRGDSINKKDRLIKEVKCVCGNPRRTFFYILHRDIIQGEFYFLTIFQQLFFCRRRRLPILHPFCALQICKSEFFCYLFFTDGRKKHVLLYICLKSAALRLHAVFSFPFLVQSANAISPFNVVNLALINGGREVKIMHPF